MRKPLEWHEPTLQDIVYINEHILNDELFTNDCSTANMFLLQEKYETQIAIKDDVLYRYYNGSKTRSGYAYPISLDRLNYCYMEDAIREILDDAKTNKRKVKFCFITQKQKFEIDQFINISWNTHRNDSDYIYFTNELATLEGKDYHKKKNHVSHFLTTYGKNWEFCPLENEDQWKDALTVADSWLEEQEIEDEDDETLTDENICIHKAVENHRKLNLKGGIIYVDSEPAAMTIASEISESVIDINYEKALKQYADEGAYSAINYFFAKESDKYLYINREEDMGVEGLRKSKLSYKPEMILDKFFGEKC